MTVQPVSPHPLRRLPRRLSGLLVTVLGASLLVVAAGRAQAATVDRVVLPPDGTVRLLGHGFGHGRGLSQYGAYGAATQGVSAGQILDFYYPGTVGVAGAPASIRVLISDDGTDLVVLWDAGLTVLDQASGASSVLPAGQERWRIVRSGAGFAVESAGPSGAWTPYSFGGRTTFAGPVQFAGPAIVRLARPADVRGYRGSLVAVTDGAGLATVNTVGYQDYLRGVVPREMPASWPAAALQAQSIAARTYAVAYTARKPAGQYWDICDTTTCQVYGGARTWVGGVLTESEDARSDAAVAATAGLVRQYAGRPIDAQFSSSNGGWTVDGGTPYLVAREDPWDGIVASTAHSWTATITRAQLQAAYPALGTPTSLEVTARDGNGEWGGRVLTIVVRGTAASGAATATTVSGTAFRTALGLRSTWFTFDVAQSAIQARYDGDAALRAVLGAPVGVERYGNGYAWQDYEYGALYWSPSTGVRLLKGAILATFRAEGGAAVLGVPINDESPAGGGGYYNHFTSGASIYWSPGTGAQLVRGAVRVRWLALGAEWGLGYPTTGEVSVGSGAVRQSFTGGEIYWSATTGAHELRGAIATAWSRGGGLPSMGLPTTDETAVPGGVSQDFSRGHTIVSSASGAWIVSGGIRVAWRAQGGAAGRLGVPLSDETATPDPGGWYSTFAGGSIVWSASTGAVTLWGAIGARWAAAGGVNSGLGLPLHDERATADGRGLYVSFGSGAAIYWSSATGARLVRGAIGALWNSYGGVRTFGLPLTEELPLGRGSGVYQLFEGAKFMWSAGTGAHAVYGAIRATYESLGSEWSRLGLPTRDEYAIPGGRRADFQFGQISWNATTGATTVTYT